MCGLVNPLLSRKLIHVILRYMAMNDLYSEPAESGPHPHTTFKIHSNIAVSCKLS
jgi:hypothetical protein